jgi:hypothetical protein
MEKRCTYLLNIIRFSKKCCFTFSDQTILGKKELHCLFIVRAFKDTVFDILNLSSTSTVN